MPAQRMAHVGRWNRRLLQVLGITVRASGIPREGATLFIANHVSWLDIPAIISVRPMRFVSKSDVRGWPVIGWLWPAAARCSSNAVADATRSV
jgi:1-acyl-sn-glycerol-3-phosphate acyltransferase